jgi:FKBP-type peptidyl-prolyl cis-trans isomerase FklB
MFVLMLVLGSLLAMSVYAAKEAAKSKKAVPPPKTAAPPKFKMQKVEPPKPVDMEKASYAIGVQLGQNFTKQGIEIKVESLIRGLNDALAGKEPELTQQEIQQIMMDLSQQMRAKQEEKQKVEAAKNLATGKAFLEENKAKEGVKVLPSGLQYKVLKEGTGNSPTENDKVRTHYQGTLIDGTEFDSSYKRNKPAEFAVKGVIKGWTEALQLMKEGGRWQLFIPPDLAYGERGNRNIPGNSTLIFEVELIAIVK